MMDPDGVISYCNRSWSRLLGYGSRNEGLIGRRASVCWTERTESALSVDSFSGGLKEDWHAEAMLKKVDGSRVDVSVSVLALTDEAGEVVSLAAVATDSAHLFDPSRLSETTGSKSDAIGLHGSCIRLIRELHRRTSEVERLEGVRDFVQAPHALKPSSPSSSHTLQSAHSPNGGERDGIR